MSTSEARAFKLRTALAVAAAFIIAAAASAQSSDGIPRAPDGHPDLSGTWDNGAGIAFVRPRKDGDSICIFGCGGARAAAGTPRRPEPRRRRRAEVSAGVHGARRRSRQAAGPGRPRAALRRARRAAHRPARQDRAACRRGRVPLRGRVGKLLPHRPDRRPAASDEQRAELLGRRRRPLGRRHARRRDA